MTPGKGWRYRRVYPCESHGFLLTERQCGFSASICYESIFLKKNFQTNFYLMFWSLNGLFL